MDKSFMKQQRFSFRKMKVGLASVAILFAFAQVGQVSADETTQPASTSAETVKKTEANKSAVEAAVAEIKADEAKPVVNQSDAKPGELVDVSKKVSPIDVKERQEGDQKIHEESATVEVTKTEVAPVKSEELPAPKTETTESTLTGKDEEGNSYTQYERVDKTTSVEMIKDTKTISKSGSADIVFVVDRSLSMKSNIDTVRDIIKKSYTSSHEGGAKVFILKNIQDIRKESANAMLKIIEEPTRDNFFILISKRLNILSTIKSRSIIYRVRKSTPEELGVDKYVYNFFLGISNDIAEYKEQEIDLMLEKSYKSIAGVLKEYEKEKNIVVKIDLYKCLRNFVQESTSLKKYEKIKFAEDIYSNASKESINLIVDYIINLVKKNKNLKEKLEYKKMLRYPVNMKLLLINLIMSI